MSEDNKHEPSEGDAGVHVAQQRLALPYPSVQEDVTDDVLEVDYPELGVDQGEEELFAVLGGQLGYDPYYPDSQIDEYETHAYHEGEYEIVVS